MYVFLLLLFPLAFWLLVRPKRLFCAGSAFFVAALVCAFRAFFMFRAPYAGSSLIVYAARSWGTFVALPMMVFVVFALFLRGALAARLAAFLSFALPFYAVYLPVEVLSAPVPFPPFMLFAKPMLYLLLLFALSALLRRGAALGAKKAGAVLVLAFASALLSALPAGIEALWYYGWAPAVWGAVCAVYAVLVVIALRLSRK